MNAKAKGNRQEHRAMRILEAAGYACTRAAASLGVFDIVAVSGQGVRLIQVKSNRPPCPAERETIALFQAPPGASKEIWIFRDRERAPSITVI
jgi:Holliday junction resolvase